jgi:hypothetical protein
MGILAVVRMIPPEVMAEHRAAALAMDRPISRTAAVFIACIWLISVTLAAWLAYQYFAG